MCTRGDRADTHGAHGPLRGAGLAACGRVVLGRVHAEAGVSAGGGAAADDDFLAADVQRLDALFLHLAWLAADNAGFRALRRFTMALLLRAFPGRRTAPRAAAARRTARRGSRRIAA